MNTFTSLILKRKNDYSLLSLFTNSLSKDLLLENPNCAYTTARLFKTEMLELNEHLLRLKNSKEFVGFSSSLFNSLNEKEFESLLLTTMRSNMEQHVINQTKQNQTGVIVGDLKMTIIVNHLKASIFAFSESFPSRDASKRVRCTVKGHGRSNPTIKNSEWVLERKKVVDETAEDTLLTNELNPDEVLEGSQTNFFIVRKDNVLQTSPDEFVLHGTIRKIVLEASKELGLSVLFKNPCLSEANEIWREAFLTSTSRLVLSIDEIKNNEIIVFKKEKNNNMVVTNKLQHWIQTNIGKKCSKL